MIRGFHQLDFEHSLQSEMTMIAGMTKINALRAPLGGEMHLDMLLALEEADLKPDGLVIVQSVSRKIRKQAATRLRLVLESVAERAQAAMEAELAAQTIAGMLEEVGHAKKRRRRA